MAYDEIRIAVIWEHLDNKLTKQESLRQVNESSWQRQSHKIEFLHATLHVQYKAFESIVHMGREYSAQNYK